MRMRKKKHGAERIAACADILIPTPPEKNISDYFSDNLPLRLEIGCGKGGFACELTEKEHGFNLLAIERSSDAICIALEKAKASSSQRPDNLRFSIACAEHLNEYFPENTFECIYLNFSDPWPKKGHYKRRLTYTSFLEEYRSILKPGGLLIQKTDNEALFDFSLEQFSSFGLKLEFVIRDLHSSELAENNVMTEYERIFVSRGQPIYSAWVRF